MLLKAYAKINWSLDTVGTRADGYHLLDMVMQTVDLHDDVELTPAAELSLSAGGRTRVPESSDNLALRAALALRERAGVQHGAAIRLHKRIPVGAGMGGGSSDAAAVLRGLNELWKLHYPEEELERVGLSLGADVPFCLRGGLCRAEGVGEVLTPLRPARAMHLVVIQPCRGLSTREVFTALGEGEPPRRPDTAGVIRALEAGQLAPLADAMYNTLQPVSERFRPPIREAVARLREHGARAAQMTGSGSAVFGVFGSAEAARTAWESLRRRYRVCHLTHTLLTDHLGDAP
ncbi:MAG: 4-(cytidine 5'-diphospho)-2-C-methyl-D-erythritol kinase [Clostridia bacterium]|nr:4-(cytidine 5'-diphospho)-2-C-methyl-D-erythritol kinase [Clostridia bacterium]